MLNPVFSIAHMRQMVPTFHKISNQVCMITVAYVFTILTVGFRKATRIPCPEMF